MPDLHINGQLVTDITLGGQDVIRINHAVSGDLLWEKAQPVPTPYFCITATSANTMVRLTSAGTNQTTTKPVFYKSTDKANWEQWDTDVYIRLTNVGDKVYLYGNNPSGIGRSTSNYSVIDLYSGAATVEGDVTTLISQYGNVSVPDFGFYELFKNTTFTGGVDFGHTGGGNLSLGQSACVGMFTGNTSVTSADMHYVTSLGTSACNQMFYGCSQFNNMYAPSVQTWDTAKTTTWLQSVKSTGTFKIDTYANVPNGTSGCPAGWTKQLPNKTVTLSALTNAFKYRTTNGGSWINLSQGSEIDIVMTATSVLYCQTNDVNYQIAVNGMTSGWNDFYYYQYSTVSDGDVITSEYVPMAYKTVNLDNQSNYEYLEAYTSQSQQSVSLSQLQSGTITVYEIDDLFVSGTTSSSSSTDLDILLNDVSQGSNSVMLRYTNLGNNDTVKLVDIVKTIYIDSGGVMYLGQYYVNGGSHPIGSSIDTVTLRDSDELTISLYDETHQILAPDGGLYDLTWSGYGSQLSDGDTFTFQSTLKSISVDTQANGIAEWSTNGGTNRYPLSAGINDFSMFNGQTLSLYVTDNNYSIFYSGTNYGQQFDLLANNWDGTTIEIRAI